MASQGASSANWEATDQLQHRKREFIGWSRWNRIGERASKASAREFASDYAGVPNYYNVSGAPGDRSLRIAGACDQATDDNRHGPICSA